MQELPHDRLLASIIAGVCDESHSLPRDRSQWLALVQAAKAHGVAPLLYASLAKRGQLDRLPSQGLDRLRAAFYRTRVANSFAYEELGSLLDLFAGEQIPVILLKGCALAASLYPSPGLRPLGDLDILVPHSAGTRIFRMLASRRWSCLQADADAQWRTASQVAFIGRTLRTNVQLDVHWHLLEESYFRQNLALDWFWQETRDFQIAGRSARIFAPSAQLLHLSLHRTLHHGGNDRLIWTHDIALLLKRHGEQIDWDKLLGTAERFRLIQPLRDSLERANTYWNVAVPAEVSAVLSSIALRRVERLAWTLRLPQHAHARSLVEGLLKPGVRSQVAYFRAQIFPRASYIQRRYNVSRPCWIPLRYLLRIGKAMGRCVSSLPALLLATWGNSPDVE